MCTKQDKPGVPKRGILPKGNLWALVNWDHRLADSNCWNIDLLSDLAEVIPIIIYSQSKMRALY